MVGPARYEQPGPRPPFTTGVIEVLGVALGSSVSSTVGFVAASSVAAAVSMLLAKRWPVVVAWLKEAKSGWTILMVATAAALAVALSSTDVGPRTVSLVVGQLSLCALLVVQRPRRGDPR